MVVYIRRGSFVLISSYTPVTLQSEGKDGRATNKQLNLWIFNLAPEKNLGIKINQSIDVISHMVVFVVPTISFVGNHQ